MLQTMKYEMSKIGGKNKYAWFRKIQFVKYIEG